MNISRTSLLHKASNIRYPIFLVKSSLQVRANRAEVEQTHLLLLYNLYLLKLKPESSHLEVVYKKKMFLKSSQNLQENISVGVPFSLKL